MEAAFYGFERLAFALPWMWAAGWVGRLLFLTAADLLGDNGAQDGICHPSRLHDVILLAICWPADWLFNSTSRTRTA